MADAPRVRPATYTPEWAVQFARSLSFEMTGYPRTAVELLLAEVERLNGLLAAAGIDPHNDVTSG